MHKVSQDLVVETMEDSNLKKRSLLHNLRYSKWISNFTEAFS
jgi:hypothetical protein